MEVRVVMQVASLPTASVTCKVTVVVPRPSGVPAAGVCVTVTEVPLQLSLAVTSTTKLGTVVDPGEQAGAIGLSGGQFVITGGVLSTTVTLKLHVAVRPTPSVAVYVTVVVPTGKVSPGL